MRKLIITIFALLVLAGCSKKDSVTYKGIEAGTISSGIFTTDNGVGMTVVGNDGKFDVNTTRRALVSYETHPVTDASHIDIDIRGLWDAISVPVTAVSPSSKDAVDAPIQIADAWFNAGYLNLLASYKGKSATHHRIYAEYTANANDITIRLYNDDSLDTTASPNDVQDIFACVKMDDVIIGYEHFCQSLGKQPVYPVSVILQWTWYALDESGPVMLHERKGTYAPPASN